MLHVKNNLQQESRTVGLDEEKNHFLKYTKVELLA